MGVTGGRVFGVEQGRRKVEPVGEEVKRGDRRRKENRIGEGGKRVRGKTEYICVLQFSLQIYILD